VPNAVIGTGLAGMERGFDGPDRHLPHDRDHLATRLRPGAHADAGGDPTIPTRAALHARTRTQMSRKGPRGGCDDGSRPGNTNREPDVQERAFKPARRTFCPAGWGEGAPRLKSIATRALPGEIDETAVPQVHLSPSPGRGRPRLRGRVKGIEIIESSHPNPLPGGERERAERAAGACIHSTGLMVRTCHAAAMRTQRGSHTVMPGSSAAVSPCGSSRSSRVLRS